MWVEQTPNGKYKACERYKDPITGKTRKVSVTMEKNTKATRKAAQTALSNKMQSVPDPANFTLEQLCKAYIQEKGKTVRASSRLTYQSNVNAILAVLPPSVKAGDITAGYANSLLKTADNAVTVNWRIRIFKALMLWAYQNDYIQSHEWLDKIKLLKDDRKARIEDKYLEEDEVTALLAAMDNQEDKLITKFLLLTGLRIGELIALEMSDIDSEYIHIRRTYQVGVNTIGNAPKTPDSERDVYIQPELAELLTEIKKYRLVIQLANGCRNDHVFFNKKGDYIRYRKYNSHLAKVSMAALGRKITPHALRHTHVSLLAAQGIPLDVVARRLGHSNDNITRDIYMHVTAKLKEKDNAALAKTKLAP